MTSTFALDVFGSLKDIPRASSWLGNGYYLNATTAAAVYSYGVDRFIGILSRPALASNASDTVWIPTRSGSGFVTFSYNATVPDNGIDFLVHDFSVIPIAGVRAAGAGQPRYTVTLSFNMPDRPVSVFIRNRGPQAFVTNASAGFTWEAD
jgi:hypothetical protein